MMAGPVRALAVWEYRLVVRARWVLVIGATFAVLAAVVTLLAFRTVRSLGLEGIGSATAALVNLGVLLPSLMGFLLGASAFAGDRDHGMLSLLLAQPVHPSRVVVGTFFGLTGSLASTLGVGYGIVFLILSGVARGEDLPALIALVAASLAVMAVGVAAGAGVASWSRGRLQALATVTGLWIIMALGFDLALAALAPTIHLGPGGLLVAVLGNPLEAARVLALLGADLEGTALGPLGAFLLTRFGTGGAMAILAAALLAWIALPLTAARWALAHRDL